MICSEILLVLVLIVLAWMVWLLMSGDDFTNSKKEKFTGTIDLPQMKPGMLTPRQLKAQEDRMKPVDIQPVVGPELENFAGDKDTLRGRISSLIHRRFGLNKEKPANEAKQPYGPTEPEQKASEKTESETFTPEIKYEGFANVSGYGDMTHDAAPFKGATVEDDGKYLTVKYSGLVDGTPGEAVQIEGTDLLTAPLVDNMLYTNSIANVNRNASQDLRGDIPVQFNESYTPFYSSTIYGAPLSQHTMTIGTL
jgi:hypothetical protein